MKPCPFHISIHFSSSGGEEALERIVVSSKLVERETYRKKPQDLLR